MSSCAVKWCGKNSRTSSFTKDGITFHRFPKCPKRKGAWIDATHRGEEWYPSHNTVICSRHFTEDCFHYMKSQRRIMETSLPTLHLPSLVSSSSDQEATQCSSCNNQGLEMHTRKQPLQNTPSEYESVTKITLCRTVIELKTKLLKVNKKLKKEREINRRLQRKVISLKSMLTKTDRYRPGHGE